MVPLDVIMNGENCWPELYENGQPKFTVADLVAVARLPHATSSGKSSVTFRIELPDGQTVLAQTTLALLTQAVTLFNTIEGR
jgi:hypothetical protein